MTFFFFFSGIAQRADIEVHCSTFRDGELSHVTATFNGSTVNTSKCSSGSMGTAQFRFFNKQSRLTECVENAYFNPKSGTCDTTWTGNARCVRRDTSNVFTFEVRFTADKTKHSQQYLKLAVSCVANVLPVNLFSENYSSCDPIPVVNGKMPNPNRAFVLIDSHEKCEPM